MDKDEKLDKVLEEIAKLNSEIEITLTPDELEVITERVFKEDLETKNDYLTDKYKNILLSFGCTTYKELYDIAQKNAEELVEKSKDFPNLAREKREVTRNGRTFETTLYVDPKIGVDNKIKAKRKINNLPEGEGESAKSLQPVIINNDELSEAKIYTKELSFLFGEYEEATIAKHLVDVYGITQVSIGFKVVDDNCGEIAYIATSGSYEDVYIRAFFELIRFCLFNELDCRVTFIQSTQMQKYLGLAYGFKGDGDNIVSSIKDLEDTFGSLEV